MVPIRFALGVPILLWFAQTALSQADKPSERCTLRGHVVDLITGEPVRKVRLSLRGLVRNRVAVATSSDDSGGFAIKDIDPGQYRLSAERNGYNRQEYGARGQSSSGTTITLAPGQQLTDLEFKLIPYGVVAGRIVDEDSEPVAGAQISVYKSAWSRGKRRLAASGGGTTNDLGEYRVYGLAPGRYIVSASPRPGRDTNVAAEGGASEAPVESAYVPTFYPGTSDASAATPVDLGPGTKLPGVNFRLLSTRTARIRGQVTNLISAQRGAETNLSVYLFPKGGGLAGIRSTAVRDAKGGFELHAVAPGSYLLVASYSQDRQRYAGTLRLEALAGQILDGINVAIGPGVGITGKARVEGDAPVNFGSIAIVIEPKGMEMVFETISSRLTDKGMFQLVNVAPADYDISVLGLPDDVYLKSIIMGRQEVMDTGFSVEPGGASYQLEVVLSTTGGLVEALVQDDKGRPAAGVPVLLVPDEKYWSEDRLFKSATTDQNGQCLIKGVAPGDYKLFALDGVDSETMRDRDLLKKMEKLGEPVSVREKERSSKQMKLTPAEAAGS